MFNGKKVYAILLASGVGRRSGCSFPKQFIKINGKRMIQYGVEAFEQNALVDEIIIVIEPSSKELTNEILKQNGYKKVTRVLNGGATRMESSSIGVNAVAEDDAKILIHDAARPFVSQKIIYDAINALDRYCAVNVSLKATDTIIKINEENLLEEIGDRDTTMQAQTPQGFISKIIKRAHSLAKSDGYTTASDDCGIVFKYRLCDVFVINGERKNLKITYPEDIVYAEKLAEFYKL